MPPELKLIDAVGLLTEDDSRRLQASIAAVPAGLGVELIVHVVDSVPGRNFRDHAVASRASLSRDRDDSVILVVALRDRHAEIATAPRYSGLFTPDAAADLLRRTLVPRMRQEKPADAVAEALAGICGMLKGGARRRPAARRYAKVAAALALVAALIGAAIWSYVRSHSCQQCGGWCRVEAFVTQEPTKVSPGSRELRYSCTRCGARRVKVETIPDLSSSDSSWTDSGSGDSGSSGSGDSGGGSDGGGGADW